jgi:nicotinamidase-related amidase
MKQTLAARSQPFLDDLDHWVEKLPSITFVEVAPFPEKAAVLSTDMINGFCYSGSLSSRRVAGIVHPIVELFKKAWEHGVRHFLLSHDTHEPDAIEFGAFPPHCVRGTEEAEAVDAIRQLPFFDQMVVIEKNSINAGINTSLNSWIEAHPEVETYIVVGNCTDLCVYQLAMHLRLEANAYQKQRRVIVPAEAVETYNRSLEIARKDGGLAHPGDLMHVLFLYHMALNGIEVVQAIR